MATQRQKEAARRNIAKARQVQSARTGLEPRTALGATPEPLEAGWVRRASG
jgi:hypothetical protein